MIKREGVHYGGQEKEDIIEFENSKQHTNVLTEEKETEEQSELMPKEGKEQKQYVFLF